MPDLQTSGVEPGRENWRLDEATESEPTSDNAAAVITSPRSTESLATRSEFLQKVQFVVAVILTVVVTYAFFLDLMLLIIVYTILFPLLVGARFVIYYQKKWHYFLLDFCYFANVCLLVNLWLLPNEWGLSMVTFGIIQASLLPAVALFGNMVVFHCMDRMTSFFIHFVPSLIVFAARWKEEGMFDDMVVVNSSSTLMTRSVWICCMGSLFVLGHQLLYIFIVEVLGRLLPSLFAVQKNKNYLTACRYLLAKNKMLQRMAKGFPSSARPMVMHAGFVLMNFLFSIPAVACYEYKALGVIYLVVFGLVALWNGATFYMRALRKAQASKNGTGGRRIRVKEVANKCAS